MGTIIIPQRFSQRYDSVANWTAKNPVLWAGEIGIESDTRREKLGDGVTAWNDLSYQIGGRMNFVGLSDGDVPVWDASAGQWKPGASASSGINLKGRKDAYADLPATGNSAGDAYLVDSDKMVYIWNGAAWPASGAGVMLSQSLARRWWRIYVVATVGSAGLASLAITQIQMRNVSGGTNLVIGAAAFASSNYSASLGASAPFASSPSADPGWVANGSMPQSIGVTFATAAAVNEVQIRIRAADAVNAPKQAPKTFVVQSSMSSSDGVNGTWRDEWAVADQVGWSLAENRIFTRS